jgi:hypothetical protein
MTYFSDFLRYSFTSLFVLWFKGELMYRLILNKTDRMDQIVKKQVAD